MKKMDTLIQKEASLSRRNDTMHIPGRYRSDTEVISREYHMKKLCKIFLQILPVFQINGT